MQQICDVHADEILGTGGDDTFYRKALRRERLEEREFWRGGDEGGFEGRAKRGRRNEDFWE
jgi:hypothetical protein